MIVGGGPTGVEVAAELHDMMVDDLRKIYPDLVPYVRIRIIELQDHVLSTYDREISNYTAQEFSRRARAPVEQAHNGGLCQHNTICGNGDFCPLLAWTEQNPLVLMCVDPQSLLG